VNPTEQQEMIDEIMDIADRQTWFDTSFVESCDEALTKYGSLTERQIAAIERIHNMLINRERRY
jgi:hypothetical protein